MLATTTEIMNTMVAIVTVPSITQRNTKNKI